MNRPVLPSAFRWVPRTWGLALECAPLADLAPHGWTTRDLRFDGPDERDAAGWPALAAGERVATEDLVRLRQVHGATVVTDSQSGAEADALVSNDPARLLTVRVADCVPLLVADRRTGAVAAIHAGWRGTVSGIASAAVGRMREMFGSDSGDLVAAIGPAIRACCYQVGPEIADAFRAAGSTGEDVASWFAPSAGSDRLQLDVVRANRDQLAAAGVPPGQVLDSGLCTACHPHLFHSYRRDKERAGRLVGFIRARTRSPR